MPLRGTIRDEKPFFNVILNGSEESWCKILRCRSG